MDIPKDDLAGYHQLVDLLLHLSVEIKEKTLMLTIILNIRELTMPGILQILHTIRQSGQECTSVGLNA